MATLPYMQLYVADYLADTMHLDATEHGAYLLLLMNYWQTEKPLPDDDRKLARIARTTDEQWLNVRSTIVEFFDNIDGTLVHHRVEKDLAKIREKSEKAKQAGKASANKRKKTSIKPDTSNGRSTDVERTFNHKEEEEDKEEDKISPPPAGGAPPTPPPKTRRAAKRAPEGWLPNDTQTDEIAEKFGLPPDQVELELAKFRDHEFRTARKDWDATWRNWLRRTGQDHARRGGRSPPPSRRTQAAQEREAAFEELRMLHGVDVNGGPHGGHDLNGPTENDQGGRLADGTESVGHGVGQPRPRPQIARQ